jgi:hypothetical protein
MQNNQLTVQILNRPNAVCAKPQQFGHRDVAFVTSFEQGIDCARLNGRVFGMGIMGQTAS